MTFAKKGKGIKLTFKKEKKTLLVISKKAKIVLVNNDWNIAIRHLYTFQLCK